MRYGQCRISVPERGVRLPRRALHTAFPGGSMSDQSTDTPLFDLAEVEYREVAGFPAYRVGTDGSLWSCFRRGRGRGQPAGSRFGAWHQIKGNISLRGHLFVHLNGSGKTRRRFIHNLVLEAFVGPCPPGMECCHGDGNPANNRLVNLRWGTRCDNREDARRHGTLLFGSRNPSAKLTEEEVREIRRLCQQGLAQGKIAKWFSVSVRTIAQIKSREHWSHVD